MKSALVIVLTACALFIAPAVQADWDVGQPAKWVQLPDTTTNGIDVKLFNTVVPPPVWLADDFLCTETGPITDVHIWGSWLGDQVADPALVGFNISIWSDIPASEGEHSRPGNPLWFTNVLYPDYVVRHWTNVVEGEGWYDPFEEVYTPFVDTNIWQYNFFFDSASAFVQTGTEAEPVVYWLAVRTIIEAGSHAFGWKTSETNWNDDAVWAEIPIAGPPLWEELIYPPDHPFAGKSMDLSFVITTEEKFDFGDAPTNYPTLLIDTGANHAIVSGGPWFGDPVGSGGDIDMPDDEPDGQPSSGADGDDLAGASPDDEDGIIFASPFIPGQAAKIDLKMPLGGQVDVWIDFNGDFDWNGLGEHVHSGPLPSGVNSIYPVVPFGATSPTYARFRIGSTIHGVIPVEGPWPDGEVEDYLIQIEDTAYDFGDAPSPGYPTLLVETGAYHIIIPGIFLGTYIDGETNGQPNGTSTGDDIAPAWLPDDEDGIILPPALVPGAAQIFFVFASAPGDLSIWIDFSADGDWGDPGEALGSFPLAPGPNVLPLFTPPTAVPGGVHARFRYSISGPVPFEYGGWPDGEVEDYEVEITHADFGDAPDSPYPTTLGSGGAWHALPASPVVYLGSLVDMEPDGQPTGSADGDDIAVSDDEDGVTVLSSLIRGGTGTIAVISSTNASLSAWVDMNQNGSWIDSGDNVLSAYPLTSGVNIISIPAPLPAAVGPTYARFRVTSLGPLSPDGYAPDGEVEDYLIEILQPSVSSTNLVITNIMVNAGVTGSVYWTALSNVTYQLQAVTNATQPYWHTWTNVGGLVTAPTNVQVDPDVSDTNKIYRVVVPWVP